MREDDSVKKFWVLMCAIAVLATLAILVKQTDTTPKPGEPAPLPQPTPPVELPKPVPPPAPQPEPAFAVTTKCEGKLWPVEWNALVDQAVDDYGSSLLKGELGAEATSICPRYKDLDRTARKHFWEQMVATIACPESSFSPTSKYHESFGVWSLGLMQMSYEDYPGHKRCDLRAAEGSKATADHPADGNAYEPKANLRCAVAVLDTQIEKGKNLFQDGKAYYWSTLNLNKNSTPGDPRGKDKTKAIWKRYYGGVQSFCGALPASLVAEAPPSADIEAAEPRAQALAPEARQ